MDDGNNVLGTANSKRSGPPCNVYQKKWALCWFNGHFFPWFKWCYILSSSHAFIFFTILLLLLLFSFFFFSKVLLWFSWWFGYFYGVLVKIALLCKRKKKLNCFIKFIFKITFLLSDSSYIIKNIFFKS